MLSSWSLHSATCSRFCASDVKDASLRGPRQAIYLMAMPPSLKFIQSLEEIWRKSRGKQCTDQLQLTPGVGLQRLYQFLSCAENIAMRLAQLRNAGALEEVEHRSHHTYHLAAGESDELTCDAAL